MLIGRSGGQAQNVRPATEFNHLFTRSGGGLTGADGTYSVLLPDGRSVWIFGDTFLGTVNADGTREKMDPIYIRNSFVIQEGETLKTLFRETPQGDRSMVIPPLVLESNGEISEDSVWYWPGDGFVVDDQLKVFFSEFRQNGSGMWDFMWTGSAIASFSLPDLQQVDIEILPEEKVDSIHFGHAVFEDEEYTYIYGLRDGKAYCARFPNGMPEGEWEYFSGNEWTDDVKTVSPILDIGISEQFSVLNLNNDYYLITQLGGLSNEIWAFHSDSPFKWSAKKGKKIHTIEIPFDNPNLFTYNALAHPQFIDEHDSILISYNMNSHELEDHFRNANIYRPRFIRVPIQQLK